MKIGFASSNQADTAVLGGGTEKEYAQDISKRCAMLLNAMGASARVFCDSLSVGNAGGARQAVKWGAALVLSLHSDGGYDKEPEHHNESLGCYQEDRTKALAQRILSGFCCRIGNRCRGLQKRPYGTPAKTGVAVLNIPEQAGIPAVLIEVCWHDRRPDVDQLKDPAWRQRAAQALADTLAEIYGLSEEEEGDVAIYPLIEMAKEGNNFRWIAPDAFTKSGLFEKVICYLNAYNETGPDTEVEIITQPGGARTTEPLKKWGRLSFNMEALAPDNVGFATIVKCPVKIAVTMTVLGK